jgi:hypothetical protein
MAMSVDSNLTAIQPDILTLGILTFASEHAKAKADIERRLRREWWPSKRLSNEMNATLLTESQFTRTASYLVLWKYALPQLSTWVSDDRFKIMIDFYKGLYESEFNEVLEDGIEYDSDEDGLISVSEKLPTHFGRLTR